MGKGSLFWFTAVFKHAASPQPRFPPLVRPISSLLVAQNETLRNKLLRYLEAFGLHPVCVSSFEEAEALCRGRPFDLIIASCELVGGAGLALESAPAPPPGQRSPDLERLHETMRMLAGMLQRRPRMRCIALCPITQLSHCAAYKEACGFTLLSRPVRLACLYQVPGRERVMEGGNEGFGWPFFLAAELLCSSRVRFASQPPHVSGGGILTLKETFP